MQNQFLPPETSGEPTLAVLPPAAPIAETLTMETAPIAETWAMESAQTVATTQAFTELHTRTRRRMRKRKYLVGAAGAMYFCMQFSGLIPGLNKSIAAHHILALPLVMMFLAVGVFYLLTSFGPLKFDANELKRLGGKNAIPVLVEYLLKNTSRSSKEDCYQALIVLLPQLQATDALLLTSRHKRALNALLKFKPADTPRWRNTEELIVSLLKAYEQVGSVEDVPFVERLAKRKPESKRQKRIQEAACACLPLLRAHVGSVDVTQTLLRASAPDTVSPDILLRPTVSTLPTPEKELLRPGNSKDVPPAA